MRRSWIPLVPFFGLGLSWSLAAGCATDATPGDDEDAATPATDAAKDSATSTDARPTPADAAKPDAATDAAKPDAADASDARADATPTDAGIVPNAGEPFDPAAPKPGDMCPAGVPEFDTVTRRCGKCGSQRAFCEAGRVVGAYGPCTNEKVGEDFCLPNAVEVGVECGLCGSQVRKCDLTCAWSTGVCLGEVVNGCVKNEVTYVEGVCANIDHVRKQTCSATCTRGAPEACAPQNDSITAAQAVGGKAKGVFALSSARTIPRLTAAACPTTSSTTINVGYHYTRVVNSGAAPINITATVAAPPTGTKPNVYVSGYLGSAPPANATAREQCIDSARDTPETITFNIPAGQSGYILVEGALATTTGRFELEVTTNFVGPEPLAPVEADITLDPVMGNTVSTPVSFVSTQVLQRMAIGVCPRGISTTVATPPYRYYRLLNNTAAARTVDISLLDPLDTILAVYPGTNPPLAQDRAQCLGTINDFCSGVTGADSCVTGISVPAMGSVVIYASTYSATSGATTLDVKTTN